MGTTNAPSPGTGVSLTEAGAAGPVRPRAARDLVVIGASAGGLPAITAVLTALPGRLEAAVLVVLHLDPRRRSLLAEVLDQRTALLVAEARDGEHLQPGQVWMAPPDQHLLVDADGALRLSQSKLVSFVRPSADLLFESAAEVYRERVIAVVLTGAGVDGRRGVAAVKRMGGTVIAQDAATSEFFGMPCAAINSGAVDLVLPLGRIGPALAALLGI